MKSDFRRGGPSRPLTRGLPILPIFLGVLLFATSCSRSGSGTSTIVTEKGVSPQPVRVGPVTVAFQLSNSGKPVSGANVSLEGDMTHAGMAPVFGDAHEVEPGHYQGQLSLNMSGDWVVLMHITLPDGHNLEDQISISGVQSK